MKNLLAEGTGAFFIALAVVMGSGPLASGAVWAAMTLAAQPFSGAQLNPAFTIALLVRRKTERRQALSTIGAQLAGGAAAALFGRLFLSCAGKADLIAPMSIDPICAFAAEFTGSFGLVWAASSAISGESAGLSRAIAVGSAAAALGSALSAVSSAAFSPATGAAMAIVGSIPLAQVWIFLLAPLLGGAAAATVFSSDEPI